MSKVVRKGNKLHVETEFTGDWSIGKEKINKLLNLLGFTESNDVEKAIVKVDFIFKDTII